jgi:hypothetical protein
MSGVDELGGRYLALVLRLARHHPGLLVAYAGPRELREAVVGEPPTPPIELHDEALRLEEEVAAIPSFSDAEASRATWLGAQANALAALARVVAGEEIALPDLVESLCDLAADREPEAALLAVHRLLDAALPPGASLRTRLTQHRERTLIPSTHVPAVADEVVAVLRRRASEDLELPGAETLIVAPIHTDGETWRGRSQAHPPLRTTLEINTGLAWTVEDVVSALGAEAYPGGHAARALRAASAADRRPEALAWLEWAPEATIGAGIAAVGLEVLLGDFELAAELRRIGREHGLTWDAELAIEVRRAHEGLAPAIANAALLLHHDGLPESEVRGYLAEIALLEPEAIEAVLSEFRHPLDRVRPFARALAPRHVRAWLTEVGQTDGLRRLMIGELTPSSVLERAGAMR